MHRQSHCPTTKGCFLVSTLEGIYGAATERSKAVLVSRDPLTNEQRKDGHGDVMANRSGMSTLTLFARLGAARGTSDSSHLTVATRPSVRSGLR